MLHMKNFHGDVAVIRVETLLLPLKEMKYLTKQNHELRIVTVYKMWQRLGAVPLNSR